MPELLREEPLTSRDKGSAGQDYVSSMAKLRGISVSRPEPDNGTDLLMNLGNKYIRVQVKARVGQENVTVPASQRRGGLSYKSLVDCVIVVDFIPLSTNCLPKLFVVPSCDLSDTQTFISLSAIQEYENRWDLLFCDQDARDAQRIGLRDRLVMSAINEFSARGFAVSPCDNGLPGLLTVTYASGEASTVLIRKTRLHTPKTKKGRTENRRYFVGAPDEMVADWLVGHEPASNTFVFVPRDKVLSLCVGKDGQRQINRGFGSSCINAFHLLAGSGTDAPRTNNN
jgi:hypothetical protein